jgi:hypothetical protein
MEIDMFIRVEEDKDHYQQKNKVNVMAQEIAIKQNIIKLFHHKKLNQ